jgi:transposase
MNCCFVVGLFKYRPPIPRPFPIRSARIRNAMGIFTMGIHPVPSSQRFDASHDRFTTACRHRQDFTSFLPTTVQRPSNRCHDIAKTGEHGRGSERIAVEIRGARKLVVACPIRQKCHAIIS